MHHQGAVADAAKVGQGPGTNLDGAAAQIER